MDKSYRSTAAPAASSNALGPEPDGDTRRAQSRNGGLEDRYTIGEAVATLQEEFPSLSVSKIRYLERRSLLDLERTSGGYRLFSPQDIDLLRTILTLQENEYLPLEVIKHRIDSGIIQIKAPGTGNEITGEAGLADGLSYTKKELCEEAGADPGFIGELVSVGVIGRGEEFGSRDLEVTRMAAEMSRYGIRPRHLRGIVAAVDREVAMFKQALNPELRSGEERRVASAVESIRYLASVDSRLKELIMAGSIESLGDS